MKLRPSILMTGAALVMAGSLAAQEPRAVPAVVPAVAVPPDQQEPQTDQPTGGIQTKPLTPLEEREKQIRLFDQRAPRTANTGRVPALPGDDAADASGPAKPARRDEQSPLPGSVAASNRKFDPRDLGEKAAGAKAEGDGASDDTADGNRDQYSGPAVLTRSYTLTTPQLAQDVRFSYNLGINEVYDSGNNNGLTTTGPNQFGRFGQQYTWGFSGRHAWRRDSLSMVYAGAWNNYPNPSLRGSNHTLSARYARILSRRLTFHVVTGGSILTQGYSLENPVTNPTNSLADTNISANPAVQLLDTTTRQITFSPSLQWQKSARLSFTAGGAWFAVERDAPGLLGLTGYQAQADVNYRLTKRITTGAYYAATFYHYTNNVALTDSHGAGGILSVAFDHSTQLRLRGGFSTFENQALTSVQIDPFLAAILGTNVGLIDQYRRNYFTEGSAELARDLRRNRTATLSYSRGLAPGNGLILASIQQSAALGFNMRLRNQYGLSTGLAWVTLSSGGQGVGKYTTESLYLAFTHPAGRRAQAALRFDYRKFNITNAGYNTPDQVRVSLGVNWTSPDGPLRLW